MFCFTRGKGKPDLSRKENLSKLLKTFTKATSFHLSAQFSPPVRVSGRCDCSAFPCTEHGRCVTWHVDNGRLNFALSSSTLFCLL